MYTAKDFETVKDIVLQAVPGALQVILFGSYAKGTAREDSDMDVMILLEREYGWLERRTVLNRIYQDTVRQGYHIDFLFKTKESFEQDKVLPTISNIIANEGKVLWMKS